MADGFFWAVKESPNLYGDSYRFPQTPAKPLSECSSALEFRAEGRISINNSIFGRLVLHQG
jgi:hypothetical protein